MARNIRIGTRESQLALWQANEVKKLLEQNNQPAELVLIKSEGDTDLKTPLYEIGVQGIFTKALDIALLNNRIDMAVHSMKDVPTQMAKGVVQAAVLPRASYKDIFVPKNNIDFLADTQGIATIATSSIRRKSQWLNKYPHHRMENLRGNVNTRLHKITENNWQGAIFAAAGLERIGLRPGNAIELDWMLPAPAQGAIIAVCRENDNELLDACATFHHEDTAICTHIERDFLRHLLGGCATPISALAVLNNGEITFKGNVLSPDGTQKLDIEQKMPANEYKTVGKTAAEILLSSGAGEILQRTANAAS